MWRIVVVEYDPGYERLNSGWEADICGCEKLNLDFRFPW